MWCFILMYVKKWHPLLDFLICFVQNLMVINSGNSLSASGSLCCSGSIHGWSKWKLEFVPTWWSMDSAKQPYMQDKAVSKQRPQTLDALFANMKELRMMVMSQQTMNGNGNQTAPRHPARWRGRGGAPPGRIGRRFGNYVKWQQWYCLL